MTRFYCLVKLWWETLMLKRDILVWATSWENPFLPYANNKGAVQPAHPRSLISAFAVRCLDSIISLVSLCSISWLYLASVAEQAGLSLTCSKTPMTCFLILMTRLVLLRVLTSWQNQQNGMCAQRRLRSACASAQSDQRLHCPHEQSCGPQLPTERTAKTLIRLGRCPGWSESSLGAQSFCWFCHEAAQITINSQNSVSSDDRHTSVKEGMLINLERRCSSICR